MSGRLKNAYAAADRADQRQRLLVARVDVAVAEAHAAGADRLVEHLDALLLVDRADQAASGTAASPGPPRPAPRSAAPATSRRRARARRSRRRPRRGSAACSRSGGAYQSRPRSRKLRAIHWKFSWRWRGVRRRVFSGIVSSRLRSATRRREPASTHSSRPRPRPMAACTASGSQLSATASPARGVRRRSFASFGAGVPRPRPRAAACSGCTPRGIGRDRSG